MPQTILLKIRLFRDIKTGTSDFLERIKSADGRIIAIVARGDFVGEGLNFLSENHFPLQLGVNSYKKGAKIRPHFHVERQIIIDRIQEVIYIKSGEALVNLFDFNGVRFKSLNLAAGDLIFFVSGGHGFEISEDTIIIEVKQGPYLGKAEDKVMIDE
jgi:hypothetical protein